MSRDERTNQGGERGAFGPLRYRAVEAKHGYWQLRVAAFDDRGRWVGRVVVEASPAGRVLRVFAKGQVEVVDEGGS